MGENTKIEWASHTLNPWIGCEKISAGCKQCYASVDTYARVSKARGLPLWGPGSTRHRTAAANWRKPLAWNRVAALKRIEAEVLGIPRERPRVFCASLCDVFEGRADLDPWRAELWPLIERCTELDWMLLTKRPENIRGMVPASWIGLKRSPYPALNAAPRWPAHVWIGTSVEDQTAADARIPHLLEVPARVRFLSMEPLLEAVDLSRWIAPRTACGGCGEVTRGDVEACEACGQSGALTLIHGAHQDEDVFRNDYEADISLVIVGGESGPGARPFDLAWARSIRDQCREAGTALFLKQAGAHVIWDGCSGPDEHWPEGTRITGRSDARDHGQGWRVWLEDHKGGDLAELPADLRIREMPRRCARQAETPAR